MEQFASGWKRHYYGKGDIIVYRLNHVGQVPAGQSPVFGANVLMLLYGDVFWPTYTTGDNSGLIATDSMKNFIQRETMNFPGSDLEGYCRFLADKFLAMYPRSKGCKSLPRKSLTKASADRRSRLRRPERATARVGDHTGKRRRGVLGPARFQTASSRWQRVPRVRARRALPALSVLTDRLAGHLDIAESAQLSLNVATEPL